MNQIEATASNVRKKCYVIGDCRWGCLDDDDVRGLLPSHHISLELERNFLGGRAPFYRCYECTDGKYISVGALEPQLDSELLVKIAAPDTFRERQNEVATWSERTTGLAELFKAKKRDE